MPELEELASQRLRWVRSLPVDVVEQPAADVYRKRLMVPVLTTLAAALGLISIATVRRTRSAAKPRDGADT